MKRILVFLIVVLMITPVYAGGRKMIRKFDEHGLKDLNNQLKKQEKLIQKLTKQLQNGGTIATKTVQSQSDFVSETVLESAGTQITSVPAVGVARDDGRLELFDESVDEATVINIEPSSYVHQTQAKIAVPSSYFLDLRGIYKTAATQQYTADLAVLHDTSGNTITITDWDETNNIGTAGPIAGGRDQAGAFTASSWIHFFFIYNPITGDKSSLSSASPTAPTLPAGYTFFVRVGSTYVYGLGQLIANYQMNDRVYLNLNTYLSDAAPVSAGVLQTYDISARIPVTAKMVHGVMGTTTAASGLKGIKVAADSGGLIFVGATIVAGSYKVDYGFVDCVPFSLPVLTAQTIWWTASTTGSIYGIGIIGYTDDL